MLRHYLWFLKTSLMAYEIVRAAQETVARLGTLSEESADELSQESFLHMFNSFTTEADIIWKPVHWFAEQINGLVST